VDELAKYLYGVIGLTGNLAGAPITSDDKGNKIYTIGYKDIACVVSDSTDANSGPADKEALIRRLISHQSVMEKVMGVYTIIPIKVGTRLAAAKDVEGALAWGYAEFSMRLKAFEGKVEAEVTALWSDLNGVIKRIAEEDLVIRDLKNMISKSPARDNRAERIKIGSMIKDGLDRERDRIHGEALRSLKRYAVDTVDHDPADEKVVMSCAFLLEKEGMDAFYSALEELNGRFGGMLNFKCVSPLPAYSFSAIKIKKVGYDDLLQAKELLGLGEQARIDDIRAAYRREALRYHPDNDRADPALGARFEAIAKAHHLLKKYCQGSSCSFKEDAFEVFFIVEPLMS
jgi:hypothetical protein